MLYRRADFIITDAIIFFNFCHLVRRALLQTITNADFCQMLLFHRIQKIVYASVVQMFL